MNDGRESNPKGMGEREKKKKKKKSSVVAFYSFLNVAEFMDRKNPTATGWTGGGWEKGKKRREGRIQLIFITTIPTRIPRRSKP